MIELADRLAVAKEFSRFAGFGVARDIGFDRAIEAIENELDFVLPSAVAAGGADGVGREKVVMAADVEVVLAEVAGGEF